MTIGAFRLPALSAAADPRQDCLQDFSEVSLARTLTYRGIVFPEGTKGVVVHCHDADAYEVEFTRPQFEVITLRRSDLVAQS